MYSFSFQPLNDKLKCHIRVNSDGRWDVKEFRIPMYRPNEKKTYIHVVNINNVLAPWITNWTVSTLCFRWMFR